MNLDEEPWIQIKDSIIFAFDSIPAEAISWTLPAEVPYPDSIIYNASKINDLDSGDGTHLLIALIDAETQQKIKWGTPLVEANQYYIVLLNTHSQSKITVSLPRTDFPLEGHREIELDPIETRIMCKLTIPKDPKGPKDLKKLVFSTTLLPHDSQNTVYKIEIPVA